MIIDLKEYVVSIKTAMKISGYTYRQNVGDWTRKDENGRFHAINEEKKKLFFHYDLFPDGDDKNHFPVRVPIHLRKEKHRILRKIGRLKIIRENKDTHA